MNSADWKMLQRSAAKGSAFELTTFRDQNMELDYAKKLLVWVIGEHHAPSDCFSSGPDTGTIKDETCPACTALKWLSRNGHSIDPKGGRGPKQGEAMINNMIGAGTSNDDISDQPQDEAALSIRPIEEIGEERYQDSLATLSDKERREKAFQAVADFVAKEKEAELASVRHQAEVYRQETHRWAISAHLDKERELLKDQVISQLRRALTIIKQVAGGVPGSEDAHDHVHKLWLVADAALSPKQEGN